MLLNFFFKKAIILVDATKKETLKSVKIYVHKFKIKSLENIVPCKRMFESIKSNIYILVGKKNCLSYLGWEKKKSLKVEKINV